MIVLCLLVALGCGCKSDLFGSDKATPSPSPTSTPTPSVNPTPTPNSETVSDNKSSDNHSGSDNRTERPVSSENPNLAVGTYTGRGLNTTYNQRGDLMLRIDSVSSTGSVKGYFEASNGLSGSASLTGTVDSKGNLSLSGTLKDGQSVAIAATVEGKTISGGYGLADTKLRTQQGNFTLTRR